MNISSPHIVRACVLGAILAGSSAANALDQYASSVIDFSTQWSAGSWSAAQALGAPDTFGYGDIATAWAPANRDGTLEFLSLGFDTPVLASGAVIRETSGNGFIYQIDAIDTGGIAHTIWSGTDDSLPGTPADFSVGWAQTAFAVNGLKLYVDTSHSAEWEEIDAVTLQGVAAVPEPTGLAMLFAGLGLVAGYARRRGQG
jgi:hypothetical protein